MRGLLLVPPGCILLERVPAALPACALLERVVGLLRHALGKNTLVVLLLMTVSETVMAQSSLDAFRWQNRLLLTFAPTGDDAAYRELQERVAAACTAVRERDLRVLGITDAGVTLDGAAAEFDTEALRQRFRVGADERALLLIGKDGGVKRRDPLGVALAEVFASIDGMPMRRREMRERGNAPQDC